MTPAVEAAVWHHYVTRGRSQPEDRVDSSPLGPRGRRPKTAPHGRHGGLAVCDCAAGWPFE
eukprot:4470095-Prymnesium_polylepis.1